MYDVRLTLEALRAYREAEGVLVRKINRCLDYLSFNPYAHPNIKRLSGAYRGRWRFRLGDWRIIYCVDEGRKEVTVMAICHRREAYR